MSADASRLRTAGLAALLFAATFAAYLPAIRCGFVWNDPDYVTRPELRPWLGLRRIWFDLGATEQYYPMLHSAFWLEHKLWGDAAAGYHLANIVFHATAACLLALVLARLWADRPDRPGSPGRRALPPEVPWLAAFLFALHPVAVESVAWISEQKNTLSAVFYLGAALAYLQGSGAGAGDGRAAPIPRYGLATALFALALLTKTTSAVLPAVLLVAIWWQRGRIDWRRDVLPLGPWFAMGAGAGLFSAWVERNYVGAAGAPFALSFAGRCLLAGRAIWFYLAKFLWPADLVFIYPRWKVDASVWWQYGYPAAVLVLVAICWRIRHRHRGPLAALMIFVASLFPVLGFLNVYGFLFSYVADHWAYLAISAAAAAAAGAWGAWRLRAKVAPGLAAGLVLCVCGTLTWRGIAAYRDETTLYRAILQRNPDAWLAHANLGMALAGAGRLPEAIAEYAQALRENPDDAEAHNNLGNALSRLRRDAEAAAEYHQALQLNPRFAEAHNGLGGILDRAGHAAEAVAEYREALRLKPAYAEPRVNLGTALAREGRLDEAIAQYQEALRLKPDSPEAHCNLGAALERMRLLPEAIAEYREALRLDPDQADAHNDLGNALFQSQRTAEAIAEYREALRVASEVPEIHCNLGMALARVGRLDEAIAQYEEALRLRPDYREARALLNVSRKQVIVKP